MTAEAESGAPIAAMLRDALACHRAGQLARAEAIYRDIIGRAPRHAEALHLLGVLELQRGNAEAALERIGEALRIDPGNAASHLDLGLALHGLKRFENALASYERALALNPSYAKAHYNRGILLREIGRPEEALASFDGALAARPDFAEALDCRGNVLSELGRAAEALECFDRALALRPDYAEALSDRGSALRRLSRPQEALGCFDAALAIRPDYAKAHGNRGNALADLGRLEEALASYERGLEIDPGQAELHCNRAGVLLKLKRFGEALAGFDRALVAKPGFAEAHSGRGNALLALRRLNEAIACQDRALALKPDYADAWLNHGNALRAAMRLPEALASYERAHALRPADATALTNCGVALLELGRRGEALERLEQALQLAPEHADARWNRALHRLLHGDFRGGWPEYEWRWKAQFSHLERNFEQPLWLGREDLRGKTILLHAEQGLGDTIQFCRYAVEVARSGATVLLEVQPEIEPLAARLEGVSRVLVKGGALPGFDFHCPLLSLPLAFGTMPETVPRGIPYLRIPDAYEKRWADRLHHLRGLRIGIAWQGNVDHYRDGHRSFPLGHFAAVAGCPGARLVSLQKGTGAEQLGDPGIAFPVADFTADLASFLDSGAVMLNLDLVITADTAVAHLAGALGVPVWVALPLAPDWRWMLDRSDSPWYPTMRLFRQRIAGDWASVFAEICETLHGSGLAGRFA
jgi:tetratricopeptide (TPR) repeat protein